MLVNETLQFTTCFSRSFHSVTSPTEWISFAVVTAVEVNLQPTNLTIVTLGMNLLVGDPDWAQTAA